jgi:threonine aldolase
VSRPVRNFRSDNVTGVAPAIMAALHEANSGPAMPYGDDPWTERVTGKAALLFEREVTVFPVATGTAANALALASIVPPFGAIYCHAQAHIATDECGAPEFYTGGAKLVGLGGAHGKIAPDDLAAALAVGGAGVVHHVQPAGLSLSQLTEAGTLYGPSELRALTALARRHGLKVHMDGARFANAAARLDCAPAELTWRAGIDVLSLGATKNGALAAEAVLFFDPALAREFAFRRKRAGHLFSKMRFLSAQLEAYLTDGLWLANARHANRLADRLAEGLALLPGCELLHPVEGNEIFARFPPGLAEALVADGFLVEPWNAEGTARMVTAFDTEMRDVDELLAAIGRRWPAGKKREGKKG